MFLQEILECRSIIKIGVEPFNDANFLFRDYGVHVAGTFDIRYLAIEAKCPSGGLGTMSEYILGVSIDKSSAIRCSNWEDSNLSSAQIDYASTDVYAPIELFKYFADKIAPEKDVKYIIKTYCSEHIDKRYFDI